MPLGPSREISMETLTIVVICIFCLFFVLTPLSSAVVARRRQRLNPADPGPKDLSRARRKLSTVTACSTASGRPDSMVRTPDLEAGLFNPEMDECPICIGPLVPEPLRRDEQSARLALAEVTTVAGACVEASTDGAPEGTSESRSKLFGVLPFRKKVKVDSGDDVLTLTTCGHSFHAKCLSSWFLIDRHDCPICRVIYYRRRRPSLPSRNLNLTLPSAHLMERSRTMGLG
jgi:hypothetical protein